MLVDKKKNVRQINFATESAVEQGAFGDARETAQLLNRGNQHKNGCWKEIVAIFENFETVDGVLSQNGVINLKHGTSV